MKYEEICQLLKYNDREDRVYMPNEVFDDLKENISKASHIGFSYSYIYLVTWLYRYTKYFNVEEVLNNNKIKEILGYNPKQQTINYLIKRNGKLTEMRYVKATRDYPISWDYNNDDGLTFQLHSELEEEMHKYIPPAPKGFFLQEPSVSLRSSIVDENGEIHDTEGTFYDISNTTEIDFEVFLYCMSNEKIRCIGFYLYSYLKMMNDYYGEGYDVPLTRLVKETGLPYATLNRYMSALKSFKMIDFQHNQDAFIPGLAEHLRLANTYTVRGYVQFNEKPVPYKRMETMSLENYFQRFEDDRKKLAPDKIEFDKDKLPF